MSGSSTDTARVVRRPGWPELAVGLGVAGIAVVPLLVNGWMPSDPVAAGLLLTAWSGIAGLAGFAAAAALRLRSLAAFGVRRTTLRWVLLGIVGGVAAFLLKGVVNVGVIAVTGLDEDPQGGYHDAAGGGLLPLVLTFAFLAVLTPIGEELLFRGVVTTVMLRLGPIVGVVGSSVVFALVHGVNLATPGAFVVGLVAAELLRRSGSIWPAVIVHGVNNLALPLLALVVGAADLA